MSNLMTNIYIGYVEEIIYKDGRPTLELRVRIPTIHGTSKKNGLAKENLPVAKPLFTPGVRYDAHTLERTLQNINKVFVIFESGDLEKPVYLGLKGNEDLFETPNDTTVEIIEQPEDPDNPGVPTPPIVISSRENKTYAQATDPATQFTVVNGDIWLDTSESDNSENGDDEPETLENPDDGQGDEDEGLNQTSEI